MLLIIYKMRNNIIFGDIANFEKNYFKSTFENLIKVIFKSHKFSLILHSLK